MTDAQLLTNWTIGLAIAAVVVIIAAALLLAVWASARSIEKGAGIALGQVQQVRANTQIIWALQDTNEVAGKLHEGATAILNNAAAIAQALHEGELRRGG